MTKEKSSLTKTEIKIPTQPEKVTTLNDRIDKLLSQELPKEEMRREIKLLIERVTHPEAFCPQCDDRIYDNKCINCGFEIVEKIPKHIEAVVNEQTNVAKLVQQMKSGNVSRDNESTRLAEQQIKGQDPNASIDINWS